ncbi:MAG: hypothetical protein ACFFER_10735 [Candidatus Thorarchaeota archaeon]
MRTRIQFTDRRCIAAVAVILIIGFGWMIASIRLTRVLYASLDTSPPPYSDFLHGSFVVTEGDTGISSPSVVVAVDLDRGENYTDFVIVFILLNITLEDFADISDVDTLVEHEDERVVGWYWYANDPPTFEFPLANLECNYVWVLWLNAVQIPDSWTLDVTLTLRFSIL